MNIYFSKCEMWLFYREAGTRQSVELAYKTLEAEFKKRENLMNQFENEVNDLRFALYHEREARINQVYILNCH